VAAEAIRFAEAGTDPDPSTATEHIYAAPRSDDPARPVRQGAPPAGTREIAFMKATLEALSEAMAQDPTLFVMGEGIGRRGGNFATTTGLFDEYGPVRLCDTPICERGFVGLATGAAMTGTRPVIDFMFADFVLDAVGEILNQVAKVQYMSSGRLKMPVLLRGCIGVGHSAATHHSGNYYPMYAHFPGLRVVVPSTAYDAKGLLARALELRRSGAVPRTSRSPLDQGAGARRRLRDRVRRGGRRPRRGPTSRWWPSRSWSIMPPKPARSWGARGSPSS
jgi:2-oxoisovalerate dehydrogenase E1 component